MVLTKNEVKLREAFGLNRANGLVLGYLYTGNHRERSKEYNLMQVYYYSSAPKFRGVVKVVHL